MNIANSDALHECTSCQMCAAVCPKDAITISVDANGFYRPTVDDNKCIDCGLCTRVCYKFDSDIFTTKSLDGYKLYAAAINDVDTLKQTSSGGIADLLARHLTEQGYHCIGVCYDTDRAIAYSKVASTPAETEGFRGSKYIQSYTVDAFKELVNRCKHERFAVFGLPCHIYALHKYLNARQQRDRHILIDMYCHGTPSLLAWQKYNSEIKHLTGFPHFDSVNFRDKIRGWGNFYVVVVVDGIPRFISSHKKDEFFNLFFSDVILNGSCYECRLRSTLLYADLRLGDFWGKLYVGNNKGVSAVTVVTELGQKLFDEIKDQIKYKEHLYRDFLPWQSYGKTYKRNEALRTTVFDQLKDANMPLCKVEKTIYRSLSLNQKIKFQLKTIVKMLPNGMINFAKKLYYR